MRRNLTYAFFAITFVTGVLTWEANKYRQPVSTQYKGVAYMCEEAYSEPCQTSKTRLLWKMVKAVSCYFRKNLHLRCVTRFEYTSRVNM